MRIAIWIGIAVTFVLYASTLAIMSYFAAPHAGHTWDELVLDFIGTTIFPLKWGVAQSAVNTMLDIYIFILPLPVIYRLNLSRRRKAQLLGVFFIGVLYVIGPHRTKSVTLNFTRGVLASTVSLVYRVKSIEGPQPDSTYYTGVLMICK